MGKFTSIFLVSLVLSMLMASLGGGLLDYGFFGFYQAAITHFAWSDPSSYVFFAILFSPLAIVLIGLFVWARDVFDETDG
ncbi:MAG: hypothetical protein ABJP70_06210 [Erythrobacter sp.]